MSEDSNAQLIDQLTKERDQLARDAITWHKHSTTLNSVAYRVSRALAWPESQNAEGFLGDPVTDVVKLIDRYVKAARVVEAVKKLMDAGEFFGARSEDQAALDALEFALDALESEKVGA